MNIRDDIRPFPDLATLPPDGGPEYNRLVFSASPYLRQHARNPVDWYPWGEEAFEKARREDRPVFLSVGYSTCHWCHVMARESFQDHQIAAFLNEHFVSVKVDREERPDVDHLYMSVCQAMTGAGGWPMTVFLTPDRRPFFAGTYFPKTDRFGRPGFTRLIRALAAMWRDERHKALETASDIVGHLLDSEKRRPAVLSPDASDRAVEQCAATFDARHGGFGNAPKFPMPHLLGLLMRRNAAGGPLPETVERTLTAMHRGGIHDQVGFGFCRYSTDERWLVPHFEKMLYDNALLLAAYADAWLIARHPEHERAARGIVAYIRRELTDTGGGFYSAENADSEGEEGKFYVFTRGEFLEAVGTERGTMLAEYFGVTEEGNFEGGRNVLHVAVDPAVWRERHSVDAQQAAAILEEARARLFDYRSRRVHPSLDDKILASWNGLAIAALARAGRAFGDEEMTAMARRAADFALDALVAPDGALLHRHWRGHSGVPGFLEDYAFLVWGLIELYESTFDARYLRRAVELNASMLRDFLDEEQGGLFFTARDGEAPIVRTKDAYDGAIPSGNSVAALNLLRLARMTGDTALEDVATGIFRAFASTVERYPTGHAMMLTALDFATGPAMEIVLSGATYEDVGPFVKELRSRFLPRAVALFHPSGPEGDEIRTLSGFLHDLRPVNGRAAAYVCENFQCALPVTDVAGFAALLHESPAGREA
jgi:uncharacterized protein